MKIIAIVAVFVIMVVLILCVVAGVDDTKLHEYDLYGEGGAEDWERQHYDGLTADEYWNEGRFD